MTHFISITLTGDLPDYCGACPFLGFSETDMVMTCPSIGDIREWAETEDEEGMYIGWMSRHPKCPIQTSSDDYQSNDLEDE